MIMVIGFIRIKIKVRLVVIKVRRDGIKSKNVLNKVRLDAKPLNTSSKPSQQLSLSITHGPGRSKTNRRRFKAKVWNRVDKIAAMDHR